MDKYKLEYEMKKRKISQEELCKKIHISRSAFYRKCNGLSEFTQSEIQAIIDFLGLESPMGIFFAEKSVLNDTVNQRETRRRRANVFSKKEKRT